MVWYIVTMTLSVIRTYIGIDVGNILVDYESTMWYIVTNDTFSDRNVFGDVKINYKNFLGYRHVEVVCNSGQRNDHFIYDTFMANKAMCRVNVAILGTVKDIRYRYKGWL